MLYQDTVPRTQRLFGWCTRSQLRVLGHWEVGCLLGRLVAQWTEAAPEKSSPSSARMAITDPIGKPFAPSCT